MYEDLTLKKRAFPELDQVLHSNLADHSQRVEVGPVKAVILMEAHRSELDGRVPAIHQFDHIHALL